jgi:hypothetical protein
LQFNRGALIFEEQSVTDGIFKDENKMDKAVVIFGKDL